MDNEEDILRLSERDTPVSQMLNSVNNEEKKCLETEELFNDLTNNKSNKNTNTGADDLIKFHAGSTELNAVSQDNDRYRKFDILNLYRNDANRKKPSEQSSRPESRSREKTDQQSDRQLHKESQSREKMDQRSDRQPRKESQSREKSEYTRNNTSTIRQENRPVVKQNEGIKSEKDPDPEIISLPSVVGTGPSSGVKRQNHSIRSNRNEAPFDDTSVDQLSVDSFHPGSQTDYQENSYVDKSYVDQQMLSRIVRSLSFRSANGCLSR